MSGYADFGSYDGLGLAELVRNKEVRPAELVEEAIGRIEKLNPELNAVVTRSFDLAREAAQDDLPAGPFKGVSFLLTAYDLVPYAILFNTSGQRATPLPLHWNDVRLPIGMHFAGFYGDKATLFRLAGQQEKGIALLRSQVSCLCS